MTPMGIKRAVGVGDPCAPGDESDITLHRPMGLVGREGVRAAPPTGAPRPASTALRIASRWHWPPLTRKPLRGPAKTYPARQISTQIPGTPVRRRTSANSAVRVNRGRIALPRYGHENLLSEIILMFEGSLLAPCYTTSDQQQRCWRLLRGA